MTDSGVTVQQAVAAIIGELGGIGKNQRNTDQGYNFRGIDDVLKQLHPLLGKHGVVIVPNVVEREYEERVSAKGSVGHCAHLHIGYRIYGPAGDSIEGSTWGEGLDYGDKATNKAMTAAYKYLLFQLFAVSDPTEDGDHESPGETARTAPATRTAPSAPRQQASGSGVPCPTDGCAGHLVQRATKTGKSPGSPYLVCDTGKNGCGLQPIWDATLEDYAARVGREIDGDIDPDEIPASLAASVPPVPKAPELSLSQQIAQLMGENTHAGVRAAFEAVPGASACLAMMPNGSWRIRGTELGALSDEAKRELVAKLSETAEIPFP